MNMQRFSEILMAYGGNPQRWSLHEREAALQFLNNSLEAQRLQQQALQLDQLLNAAPMPQLSEALQKRILKSTQPSVFKRFFEWFSFKQPLKIATAFAIPCLIALTVWLSMPFSPFFYQPEIDYFSHQEMSLLALLEEEELTLTEFLL
jgi:hypothetical protein